MKEMQERLEAAREYHPCVVVRNLSTMEELELYGVTPEQAVCLAADPGARGGKTNAQNMPFGWPITVAGMLPECTYGEASVAYKDWCALYDQSLEPRNGFGEAPGELTYIDISTTYLTDAECDILNMGSIASPPPDAPLMAYRKEAKDSRPGWGEHYGWFVYVPADAIDEVLPALPAGMLRHIMAVAYAEGHTLVVFDRDGGMRESFNGVHDALTGREMRKQEEEGHDG